MSIDPKKFGLSNSLVNAVNEALKGDQHKIDANKNGKIDAQDFKKLRGEELKGNQHKIDKNKNGKIDAHDFKMLRKEEVEQIDEKVKTTHENPLVTVHDKDGLHTHANLSTANKIFNTKVKHTDVHAGPVKTKDGHETKNNLTFAISKHHASAMKEEVEQIDELSSTTLQRYRTKALAHKSKVSPDNPYSSPEHKAAIRQDRNRSQGRQLSWKKMIHQGAKVPASKSKPTTEEVEQVDEISKATLGSYVTKAAGSAATHTGAAAAYGGSSKNPDPKKMAQHQAIATKRTTGIQKAVGKLTKEEAEQTDEAMSPKQKAHSNRLKNNPGRKGSVFDPSSNFDAPNHKVDVVVSKDNKKETKNDVVQAKDKHDAMFKIQMKYHKMGYKVHDTKHKGTVKEETEITEADDAIAKQIAAKKDAMQKQIQQKIAQKQMSTMQAKANKRLSSINASSHDDKEEMKKGGKEKIEINPPLKEAEELPKAVVKKGHEIAKSLIKHRAKVREPYAVGMATAKKSAGIKD
jgi:hypothetical protein